MFCTAAPTNAETFTNNAISPRFPAMLSGQVAGTCPWECSFKVTVEADSCVCRLRLCEDARMDA